MKNPLRFLGILLIVAQAFGAVPAFTDFNTNQFDVTGYKVSILNWSTNQIQTDNRIWFGQEYLSPWFGTLRSNLTAIVIFDGDSTTATYGSPNPVLYTRDQLFFRSCAYPKLLSWNYGLGGDTAYNWSTSTNVAGLISAKPTLIVLRYGLNDCNFPFPNDFAAGLASYSNSMVLGLTTIRASLDPACTAIILESPNSASDTNTVYTNRNMIWCKAVADCDRAIARRFACCFHDVFQLMWDSGAYSTNWMTTDHVHPMQEWNQILNADFVDKLWPPAVAESLSLRPLESVYQPLVSDVPTNYPYGTSLMFAHTANGWPIEGAVRTSRSADGVYLQENFDYQSGGYNVWRTGHHQTNWNDWRWPIFNDSKGKMTVYGPNTNLVGSGAGLQLTSPDISEQVFFGLGETNTAYIALLSPPSTWTYPLYFSTNLVSVPSLSAQSNLYAQNLFLNGTNVYHTMMGASNLSAQATMFPVWINYTNGNAVLDLTNCNQVLVWNTTTNCTVSFDSTCNTNGYSVMLVQTGTGVLVVTSATGGTVGEVATYYQPNGACSYLSDAANFKALTRGPTGNPASALVYASPATSNGPPTMRSLVDSDLTGTTIRILNGNVSVASVTITNNPTFNGVTNVVGTSVVGQLCVTNNGHVYYIDLKQ